jgi:hypothetical protein
MKKAMAMDGLPVRVVYKNKKAIQKLSHGKIFSIYFGFQRLLLGPI